MRWHHKWFFRHQHIGGDLHFPYNLPGFNDTGAHNIISAIFGDYKASKGTPFILITFGSKQIQWGEKILKGESLARACTCSTSWVRLNTGSYRKATMTLNPEKCYTIHPNGYLIQYLPGIGNQSKVVKHSDTWNSKYNGNTKFGIICNLKSVFPKIKMCIGGA